MNAKDLKPGMKVAIIYEDPFYKPIKAEVIGVGGYHANHESSTNKPIAHQVKILTGNDKNKIYNLAGKRIVREWTTDDEDRYQENRQRLLLREKEIAEKAYAEEQRVQLIDQTINQLALLGIIASRGSGYYSMDLNGGNYQHTSVLIVRSPDEMKKIVEFYIINKLTDSPTLEDNNLV